MKLKNLKDDFDKGNVDNTWEYAEQVLGADVIL